LNSEVANEEKMMKGELIGKRDWASAQFEGEDPSTTLKRRRI